MDLVESNLFTPPIILLQTVMEEVRHRSLPLYNRLKALTKMDDKRIWVFYNEYRSSVIIFLLASHRLDSNMAEKLLSSVKRMKRLTTAMIEVRPKLLPSLSVPLTPRCRHSESYCLVQLSHKRHSTTDSRSSNANITHRSSHDRRCREYAKGRKAGHCLSLRYILIHTPRQLPIFYEQCESMLRA